MEKSSSSIEYKLETAFQFRLYVFSAMIVTALAVFIFQLFNLQVVNGSENTLKAERFVHKSEVLPASRGQVYDRNFRSPERSFALIQNSASLDVIVNTNLFKNNPEKIKGFVTNFYTALSIPKIYFENELTEPKFTKKIKSKTPIVLLQGITNAQIERITQFDNIGRYVLFVPTPKRIYTMGPALAHVTGYVGLPNTNDLKNPEIKSYQLIGKTGLELQYDKYLRGVDGNRYQKRNSEGNIEEENIISHAQMGNNVILTIDKDVQKAAFNALNGFRGTVIAMKVATGEILAMASNPSYDPNIVSGKNSQTKADSPEKSEQERRISE